MNNTFRLSFKQPQQNNLPGPSVAQVSVVSLSDGEMITPQAVSYQEFECHIETLKGELDQLKKEAQKKYRAVNT